MPDTRTESACMMVHRFCCGDDGVGVLWHSCAPAAECVAAAASQDCSCAPAERLLGSVSCGTAGLPPPFCGPAEQYFLPMLVQLKLIGVRFWAGTEMRLQEHESWYNVGGGLLHYYFESSPCEMDPIM